MTIPWLDEIRDDISADERFAPEGRMSVVDRKRLIALVAIASAAQIWMNDENSLDAHADCVIQESVEAAEQVE